MSDLNLSQGMSSAIESVLGNASLTDFIIDVTITNDNNPLYSFTPDWVERITILQDFADAYTDEITLEFGVAPQDYINMFNNTQGLSVNITFVYVNPQTGNKAFSPPPLARTYKALMIDPKDLLKQHTTGQLMPTDQMPLVETHVSRREHVKLSLMESSAYTIRQRQYYGTKPDADLASVIHFIASQFGVKQIYLVPPDNKMTWSHVVVPPAQNFDEIFDFLQRQYGIYMKGIEWYYTGGILYVYPPYENNPSIKYVADIYNAPGGSYAGLLSFHETVPASNGVSIVSTTKVHTTDISRPAAESVGTSYGFMRAATLIDKTTTTNAQGTFVNNNNSLTVGTVTDRAASQNANNLKYTETTDNIFYHTSNLAKWNAVLIECGWHKAVPFLLVPGHNVRYHYDKNGIFTNQQGILEGAAYVFTRSQKIGPNYTYSGTAALKIRAASDVT